MRAVAYDRTGELREVELDVPSPVAGEVRVRVAFSGINPADWKNRRRHTGDDIVVPHHDGAGIIDAVGSGVDPARVGRRVWLRETARQRCGGTAQEWTVVPESHAVDLPTHVSLRAAATLGVPALTAHRCLTVGEDGPLEVAPGALAGRTVLVAGGAGAVGHAAIQLARWGGATVISTVSSPTKGALAAAAGAHHVVDYRSPSSASQVREIAPRGVDVVVEVAPHENAALDTAVLAPGGAVACYAGAAGAPLGIEVGPLLGANARWQFVSVFTIPERAQAAGVRAVRAALVDDALPVGDSAGLPLHLFPLHETAAAHAAVESGTTGKVLVEVAGDLDVVASEG